MTLFVNLLDMATVWTPASDGDLFGARKTGEVRPCRFLCSKSTGPATRKRSSFTGRWNNGEINTRVAETMVD